MVVLMVTAPSAQAAFPGDNGKLAYTSFNSAAGGYQTCTRNPDGTGLDCFTLGGDNGVAWSPNGLRLALTPNSSNVTTVDPDGTDATQITQFDNGFTFRAAWSPDGQKLAFSREEEPDPACDPAENCPTLDIWAMNADGSGQRVRFDLGDDIDPVWSPDGEKIAFSVSFGGSSSIYVGPAEGFGPTTLIHTGLEPDWSPDGSWIAFAAGAGGIHDVYKMRADGTDVTLLTTDGTSVGNRSPVWSPDGTRIAFNSQSTATPRAFPARVDAVNADGTGRITLFTLTTDDFLSGVDWQPLLRGYPRPKGATPTRVPLVPAAKPCTSPNSTHGAPLSYGSCSPPEPEATATFLGIGDGHPVPARSIGSVLLKALLFTPGPEDDADVSINVRITHVLNASDHADYAGELRLELPLRITDRFNRPHPNVTGPGTVADTSFFATVPCTVTPSDPLTGSTCELSSTADALLPGTVRQGARAVWGLGQVRLHDGGADGDAETAGDNGLLAVQGVFIP